MTDSFWPVVVQASLRLKEQSRSTNPPYCLPQEPERFHGTGLAALGTFQHPLLEKIPLVKETVRDSSVQFACEKVISLKALAAVFKQDARPQLSSGSQRCDFMRRSKQIAADHEQKLELYGP